MPRSSFNVVILAAGRGERFSAAGVATPKPLIEFRNETLLLHTYMLAVQMAPARIVVVATSDEVAGAAWRMQRARRELGDNDKVVAVSVTQPGPAASALLAGAHLPPDEPVVFMDCDNYYAPDAREWVDRLPIGAQFLTVAMQPPWLAATNFCCVRVQDGTVVDMNEKLGYFGLGKLGSWRVGTGIYGFPSFDLFRRRAATASYSSTNERSMSSILSIGCGTVEVSGWHPVGTPEQMAAAEEALK